MTIFFVVISLTSKVNNCQTLQKEKIKTSFVSTESPVNWQLSPCHGKPQKTAF
jgi:hypothetical protein